MGFWNAFDVYDKKKHADPAVSIGNNSNVGKGVTNFLYSKEYRGPREDNMAPHMPVTGPQRANLIQSAANSPSISDDIHDGKVDTVTGPSGQMVDISKMSQTEFENLYKGMRKGGEPNNRVNF